MPDTPLGITYPESGGHTRLWEHFQTLAEDVDDLITSTITQSGTVTATWLSLSGNLSRANGTVTFDVPFLFPPTVSANADNGFRWATAENVTTTGFLFKVFDGRSAASGTEQVGSWTATGIVGIGNAP